MAYRTLHSVPLALALTACTVPKILGNNDTETEGDTDTATSTGDETDTDTDTDTDTESESDTDGAPICHAGDAGAPGGELSWSLAGDALPSFPIAAAAADAEDQIVLVGTSHTSGPTDVHIERRGDDGALLWSQVYDGAKGLSERALDVVVDGAGRTHVLLVETILSIPGDLEQGIPDTIDARLVVLRIDPGGAQLWRWEQSHPPVAEYEQYVPRGALVPAGEGVQVLLEAFGEPTQVIGLDAAGAELSTIALASPVGLAVERFGFAADGGAILSGDLEGTLGQHSLWIGRFDAAGAVAWSDSFGDLSDKPTAVVAMSGGDLLLAWSTSEPGGIVNQLRRYDPAGAALWTTPLDLVGVDSGVLGGAVRCDGVILLTGGSERTPAPESAWGFRSELWVAAYAADGAALWTRSFAFGEVESAGEGNAIAGLWGGDAIVVGSSLDASSEPQPWIGRFAGG